MRLADRIAQQKSPFVVQDLTTNAILQLSGAADFGNHIERCPTRYVLSDELTTLCAAIAYSKGARTLDCADLLRIPSERVWLEWCEAPWQIELQRYGFQPPADGSATLGRRGALITSSREGRSGVIRTFWTTGNSDADVLASSMEAFFDFDTPVDEEQEPPDDPSRPTFSVSDGMNDGVDILRRHFRFRYERTWADYYAKAALSAEKSSAIARHALGTIAIDLPVILAFILLLAARPSLPRRPLMLERLNRSRMKKGKGPLLDHIEVFSPLLPQYKSSTSSLGVPGRRSPRLHHVRGHLVRRGSSLFWRVPHLRGNARTGVIRTRTVTWTVDSPTARMSGIARDAQTRGRP